MKKQYRTSETFLFKTIVSIYHNGKHISSKRLYIDDAEKYVNSLEKNGYTYGFTQEEVDEAKRLYDYKLSNLIGGNAK